MWWKATGQEPSKTETGNRAPMDEGDEADRISQVILKASLLAKRPGGPKPDGQCHFCGDPIPPGWRWCDPDCMQDWERQQRK